jgi:hypothetical protein
MTEVFQQVQVSTSELHDAERRRRLASVYRLLIELGHRESSVAEKCKAEQGEMDNQSRGNS